MMGSNNNFLLKIHMEENNSIKEIYLNKERRSFTFVNDECVSDLIIPEFKITSLNMILEHVSDNNENNTYYAEYYKGEETIREYDKEKIELLVNMVTKININDFIDYQDKIKINDYYIDNIVDAYNCVLPKEIKKVLSYTTNGVVFSGDEKIYLIPHSEIVENKNKTMNFIPFMIRNNNSYIGYDYKASLLKEICDDKVLREGNTLKELLEKEILTEKSNEIKVEKKEKNNITDLDEQYENTMKNIDYQLERLNNGITKEKDNFDEKKQIEDEIRIGVRKSLEELEETNNFIDEIDINIEKVVLKHNHIKSNKQKERNIKTKDVIKTPKIKEKTNSKTNENEKFIEFLKEYDKKHTEDKLNKNFQNFLIDYDKKHAKEKEDKAFQEFLKEYDKKHQKAKENKTFQNFLKQYEENKKKEKEQVEFQNFLKQYEKKLRKTKEDEEFRKFLTQYETKLKKKKEEEKIKKVLKEFNQQEFKEELKAKISETLNKYNVVEETEEEFENLLQEYKENPNKTEEQAYFHEFLDNYNQEYQQQKQDFTNYLNEECQKHPSSDNMTFQKFLKEYDNNLKKTREEILFQDFLKKYDKEHKKEKEKQAFMDFLVDYDKKHGKEKENELFNDFLKKYEIKLKNDREFQKFLKEYDKEHGKEKENKLFNEFLKEYETKLKNDREFQKFLKEYDKEHGKEKENKLFNKFLKEYETKLKNDREFKKFLKEYDKKYAIEKENKIFNEFLIQYEKKKKKEKQNKEFQKFLKEYEENKKKEKEQTMFQEFLLQYENKLKKNKENEEFRQFLIKYEEKIQKEKENELFQQFLIIADEKHRQENMEKLLKAEKALREETTSLNEQIYNSVINSFENYKINFNDTQKLIVEHLPYYEFTSGFDVIQIPEIEVDKMTLLPKGELDFGKMKLIVNALSRNKVELLVQNATSIVDQTNNKIKKGMNLLLDLNNEITLRLNKKEAMETWTLTMEKSTFEKELRNIDYHKLMNLIINTDGYKKLGNIEKYELQKSVMLFLDFIMKNKEEEKLEELYEILDKNPLSYEEYITKYNIDNSLELNNSLSTYEEKKKFMTKLNFVNGLIEEKWLDYPRYIFKSHDYFYKDEFLESYIENLNSTIKEKDFSSYLKKMFKDYEVFEKLTDEGKENLNKCLEYLSVVYKTHPDIGEDIKYDIEKTFMIGADEEEMALLISKICRKGIKDYSVFVEYDAMLKEKYRLGELKYPIYSESFGIDEIRNGGEYDEF